jgi:hypothetical protein
MRFISTLCLLLGASFASYAGLITSATGNMAGPNGYLQNFNTGSLSPNGSLATNNPLPLTSFFPTGIAIGTSGVNVTITSGGPGGNPGSYNTGSTGALREISSGNYVITNWSGADVSVASSFARTITLTFSQAISEFLVDYSGSNSPQSTNYFYINGNTGTTYSLPSGSGSIGLDASTITSVTFYTNGPDGNLGIGSDLVTLDNLRIVTNANGNPNTGTGTGNPNPGQVPEPSTYALIGAGLMGVFYARRKK